MTSFPFPENPLLQKIFATALLSGSVFIPAAAQAPSSPGKPLPTGPMQAKVKAECTQCHTTDRITEQHLTRDEWSQKLEKMEGLGAVIPDADRDGILAYLAKNFGPQKGTKNAPKKSGSANSDSGGSQLSRNPAIQRPRDSRSKALPTQRPSPQQKWLAESTH